MVYCDWLTGVRAGLDDWTVMPPKQTTEDNVTFRIASLNCWGLLYSPKRKPRFAQIQRYLLEENNEFDFVTLQEVWMSSDFMRLKEAIKDRYPHTVYFPCGVIGSGLCILSRHPIAQRFFKRYSLNGSIDRIWHGDYFSGKGVGGVRVLINGVTLDLYTTHLHAEYNPEKLGYTAHRLAQLQELAQFVEHTSRPTHVAIVTGDLNTTPEDFPYRMMVAGGCGNKLEPPLKDAWAELYGQRGVDACMADSPTAALAVEQSTGHTYNLPTSTHYIKKHPSQRIDYFLYAPRPGVVCKSLDLLTEDVLYEPKMSLSDHLFMKAEFSINPAELATSGYSADPNPLTLKEQKEMVHKALQIFATKRLHVIRWQRFYMSVVVLMLLIFVALTITTAITIPGDQLTPLLTLTLFGVQPAVLVTAFSCLFLARLFLVEEKATLNHFISEWEGWLVYHEITSPTETSLVILNE
ncbi:putative neutral sphingomyelinase-like protein [Paramicrosporidium saccamoebae]|uniref:Putative neutral sphingomyelinase-like protein n=1 Tax=Paramicrosporidium saccamoebae TaxID=1246581 RepID=A0A2H9TKW3_9FUNG|nr:putative neutral sphingomyelinase-like protein [Paramicrosporidium saccamoebae]